VSSPGSFDECRPNARWANPQTKPTDLAYESAGGSYHPQPPSPFIIVIQPESYTHFTIARRVEGWVILGKASLEVTPTTLSTVFFP